LIKAALKDEGCVLADDAIVSLAVIPFADQYVFSVLSNSTLSDLFFNPTSKELSFIVSGPQGTAGYVNVTIAKSLIADVRELKVYVDGTEITYNVLPIGESWLLHFTYNHSARYVVINLGPEISLKTQLEIIAILSIIVILGGTFGSLYFLKLRKKKTNGKRINANHFVQVNVLAIVRVYKHPLS